MRTGVAAQHRGFFHETVLYGSEEELLGVVTPFLADGIEAGEPTVVAVSEANEQLIRTAIGDVPEISFLSDFYIRPASVIVSYRKALMAYVADGAEQVRLVGEIPNPGLGEPWDWWARYEAAVNQIYDEFPLWAMCLYDTRITPVDVVADVVRTHPYLATADGQHFTNDRFEDPVAFLTQRPSAAADPLETSVPVIELVDPAPLAVRQVLREVCLDPARVDDFLIAVSEAVVNAQMHSRSPVRVRVWTAPDRLLVTVTDPGRGPGDPFVGLQPADGASGGGFGLWIAHQLCSHVAMSHNGDGFTIRLVQCLGAGDRRH